MSKWVHSYPTTGQHSQLSWRISNGLQALVHVCAACLLAQESGSFETSNFAAAFGLRGSGMQNWPKNLVSSHSSPMGQHSQAELSEKLELWQLLATVLVQVVWAGAPLVVITKAEIAKIVARANIILHKN